METVRIKKISPPAGKRPPAAPAASKSLFTKKHMKRSHLLGARPLVDAVLEDDVVHIEQEVE